MCPKALKKLDPTSWRDFVSWIVGGPEVGLSKSILLSEHASFLSLYFRIFLLECSVREVRVAVATILEKTLDSALFYQDKVGVIS